MQSVTPAEIRGTFLLTIARDIIAGVPQSVLRDWIKLSLYCTATVVLDATPPHKYFRACQSSEKVAADSDAMSRTNPQKNYEVIYFRDVLAHGATTGTAAAIAAVYAVVETSK